MTSSRCCVDTLRPPFRILTVVDQYTRECLCTYADRSQTGEKVSEQLDRLIPLRGAPESITSDNGSEFTGKAMDLWAHQAGVKLKMKELENLNTTSNEHGRASTAWRRRIQ